MQVLLLGVSHHTASIDLRERLAYAPDRLPAALGVLAQQPGLGEVVLLSTCNRSETYVTCEDPEATRALLARFLVEYHNVPADIVEPHLYALTDADAVGHLFRVAAGLDSLVVGEPQILGQVKQAYTVATEQHCTGALLNRLFHHAFTVGKRVRAETGLADGAVSVSYAALGLARKICGDLAGLTALVLGAGDMASLTARHLQAQSLGALLISSRTPSHAAELAADVGGRVIPWDETDAALSAADVVVSATGATQPIVTRERVRRAMRGRRARPLFLIDIAVPRDVEPAAASIEQVFLYNIDDLQGIVSENLSRRATEVARAEAIVVQEVETFMAWARSRTAIPTVVALRRRFEAIRQAELVRLQPKLAALSPDAKARVDEVTRLIVEKLLLTPTEQLKGLSDRETVEAYADALTRLFALGPDGGIDSGTDSGIGGGPDGPGGDAGSNGDDDDAARRRRNMAVKS